MIKIENLKKTYHTGETEVKALREINLKIDKGEFISIAGPSGSGKTTLLNLIGCIDNPDSGQIYIDERAVSLMNKNDKAMFRREKLGFVFQSYNLIPVLTAYENVAFSLNLLGTDNDTIKNEVNKILEEVGLKGMENRRPSKLSGGQQQRVAVARALVKKPAIILADEPTANLDSGTGEDVIKLMKEMNRKHNITFIFSTHDRMVMDYAERLIQLHDGAVQSDTVRS